MGNRFRIHGDNIIECERIVKILITETKPTSMEISLISPSTLVYRFIFDYLGYCFSWELELLPGFNKSGRSRWESNIFKGLKDGGSFLDETPDVIVTSVAGEDEEIICAIEFCSALQAGNQAWQRSGRAFSTGRTGCPYLYIVDFVKYELNSETRRRKALRFPNAAVPYSYIHFSKETDNFVAQVYVRSEEFNKEKDHSLQNFNESDFAKKELAQYIVMRMCGFDTSCVEEIILQKNLNVVMFLANRAPKGTNFTPEEWNRLYRYRGDIISFALTNSRFNFHKTIASKGGHGKSKKFIDLVDSLSVGMASRDLPFGIIPANRRQEFVNELQLLYPLFDSELLDKIALGKSDLLLCIAKGFKPKGDDNRPDRGILPLVSMLSSENVEIMTYIYGPVTGRNRDVLIRNPRDLACSNGFWKSILALSDYVVLDVPILNREYTDDKILLDTSLIKKDYMQQNIGENALTQKVFSSVPKSFHEDDVDTGIHFLFSHLLRGVCFEGMCNPPGGDWSGLSVIDCQREVRWLSLPRVTNGGKRPDHVIELFHVFRRPVLLIIESKERSRDLEINVGHGLIKYIEALMCYVPSVERPAFRQNEEWIWSDDFVDFDDFESISAAAYLKDYAHPDRVVFEKTRCDMLFIMDPVECGWDIEISTNTKTAQKLKQFVIEKLDACFFEDITIS